GTPVRHGGGRHRPWPAGVGRARPRHHDAGLLLRRAWSPALRAGPAGQRRRGRVGRPGGLGPVGRRRSVVSTVWSRASAPPPLYAPIRSTWSSGPATRWTRSVGRSGTPPAPMA